MLRRPLLVLCLALLVATIAVGEKDAKVAFASPQWVDLARTVLEELVAEHGEAGKAFSACEVFTDAPPGMAGPDETTAAWYFRIHGKTVTVGEGEIEDADLNVRVDYQSVLPVARLVYTPEMLAARESSPSQIDGEALDDRPDMPSYLVQLHNRMAVVTR